MPSLNEDARADQWLYAKLNVADITSLLGPALGSDPNIYADEPDPSANFPLVIYRQIAPFIADSSMQNRMMMRGQYAVFAKVQDRAYPHTLDSWIRDKLHAKREEVDEFVIRCERVGNWRDSYAVDGKPYRELGGRFLLTLTMKT